MTALGISTVARSAVYRGPTFVPMATAEATVSGAVETDQGAEQETQQWQEAAQRRKRRREHSGLGSQSADAYQSDPLLARRELARKITLMIDRFEQVIERIDDFVATQIAFGEAGTRAANPQDQALLSVARDASHALDEAVASTEEFLQDDADFGSVPDQPERLNILV